MTIPCLSWDSRDADQPEIAQPNPLTLHELVDQYFRNNDSDERTKLAASIKKATDASIESVAAAIRQLMVWKPIPSGDFNIQTSTSGTITARYRGLRNLDPALRRGLVLCMPSDDELADTNRTLNRALAILRPSLQDCCCVVALSRPIGGRFHQHPASAEDLRGIIRELRRRMPLDTDRLYLFGFQEGGSSAWMASLFQPDPFAGVITVASNPKLPFPQQTYPLLLPNLKELPQTVIAPVLDRSNAAPLSVTDAHLNAIMAIARLTSLPINKVTVPFDSGEFGMLPRWSANEDVSTAIRLQTRAKPGRSVSHWFRYPSQGDVGWLRAAKTYGDVWTEDQLSIAVAPTTDRDAFITDAFKEKLFHLGGRVEGQTIHLETKRIAELELRIFDGMLDHAKPVTVIINGRKRHDGPINPNIETMLESAYENWDFQRLVLARLSFPIRPD